jgi:hypothetical protein
MKEDFEHHFEIATEFQQKTPKLPAMTSLIMIASFPANDGCKEIAETMRYC